MTRFLRAIAVPLLVVAVLLLSCGFWWMHFSDSTSPGGDSAKPQVEAGGQSARLRAKIQDPSARVALDPVLAEAPEVGGEGIEEAPAALPELLEDAGPRDMSGTGLVVGKVLDARTSEPIPGAWLELRGSGRGLAAAAGSDEAGDYELRARPGLYRLTCRANSEGGRAGPALGAHVIDDVEMVADTILYRDAYLFGGTTVSGSFRFAERNGTICDGELLRSNGGPLPAAEFSVTFRVVEGEAGGEAPVPAKFSLEGIEPGGYRIRLYLDVGRTLWVDKEISVESHPLDVGEVVLNEDLFFEHATL